MELNGQQGSNDVWAVEYVYEALKLNGGNGRAKGDRDSESIMNWDNGIGPLATYILGILMLL